MENENNMPTPTIKTKQTVFNALRSNGYTQRESGIFAGVNDKTAGVYEKKRKKDIKNKLVEINDLIDRLKVQNDQSQNNIADTLQATLKVEELYKKREKLMLEL